MTSLDTLKAKLLRPCHEDFAVLCQFCAKIITQCLYPYIKIICSSKTMREISNEFHQGEPHVTTKMFLVIFKHIASQFEKIGPIFFKFQAIFILAICSNRRQETLSVPNDSLK